MSSVDIKYSMHDVSYHVTSNSVFAWVKKSVNIASSP